MSDTSGYKMGQDEFKGRVLQSLEDIRNDIGELKDGMVYMNREMTIIKVDLADKACKKDIKEVRAQISNIKLVSSVLGAVAGIFGGIGTLLTKKW